MGKKGITPKSLRRKVFKGANRSELIRLFLECGVLDNQRKWRIALDALRVKRHKVYKRLLKEKRILTKETYNA